MGGVVETLFTILAIAFGVSMILLLPKYAKFIHQQPKLHREQMEKKEREQNEKSGPGDSPENP